MAKGDPKKPKGKMSAYAFFVQTCREEHKKKNPEVPVNFAEFSKKCSERWKTMSGKEKSKFDEMAKADKVRYDREMKDYGPAKGGKKKKDPNAPKRPPSGFFLFCSEFRPKIKSANPGISIGDVAKKLGEMWNNLSDSEKQPYINKAAKLKEKYEKDVADYKSKGKFDGAKGAAKVARKKVEEEDEEDEEEEEEEEEEEDEEEDEEGGEEASPPGGVSRPAEGSKSEGSEGSPPADGLLSEVAEDSPAGGPALSQASSGACFPRKRISSKSLKVGMIPAPKRLCLIQEPKVHEPVRIAYDRPRGRPVSKKKKPKDFDFAQQKLTDKNLGFQMLQKMGWKEGHGLGSCGKGIREPVSVGSASEGEGLGADGQEHKEDTFDVFRQRMMQMYRHRRASK